MKQLLITPSMGKKLIGMAIAQHPDIQRVLGTGTLVIIAGSTNAYVAEEILNSIGQGDDFDRFGFRRGVVAPTGFEVPQVEFPGDVIIRDGVRLMGRTIFDMVDELDIGDMVLKGANAFDAHGQAAVHIGGRKGGTILAAMTAIIGRRVQLLIPVGLEKRVFENVHTIAQHCNALGAEGPRLLPMPGKIFTEIDALRLLTGVDAYLISAGGVYGAEGSVRLGIKGSDAQVWDSEKLISSIGDTPPCII